MSNQKRNRVLFLCTHNSARSQMAEGLLRQLGGKTYDVFSAGTEQTFVRPQAIQVMSEIGVDISRQKSKRLDYYFQDEFDEVITVCDAANEACPVFPNAKSRRHWNFPDPSTAPGTQEQQLAFYRSVRDAIKDRIEVEIVGKSS